MFEEEWGMLSWVVFGTLVGSLTSLLIVKTSRWLSAYTTITLLGS